LRGTGDGESVVMRVYDIDAVVTVTGRCNVVNTYTVVTGVGIYTMCWTFETNWSISSLKEDQIRMLLSPLTKYVYMYLHCVP